MRSIILVILFVGIAIIIPNRVIANDKPHVKIARISETPNRHDATGHKKI